MKSNWKTVKLQELGRVVGGATPSTKNEAFYGGSIPWLTPKDLADYSERYISRGERSITEEGLNSCSTELLPAGTVLFSSRAPIGYVAIASNSICTNQGFKSVVPDTGVVDPLFLYYLLVFNKEKIKSAGSGTTFKEVSGNVMKNIEVEIPTSVDYQRKIARVLSSIDDQIEGNARINKNLLEQAISIFNWFYDSSTHQQPFSSVINVFGGGTPKTSDPNFWNGDIPFFTPKDVGNPYTFKTEKYITDDGLAKCNSRLYPTNTTFVTARGTVGKVSLAGVPMAMNQSCYALVSDTLDPILVYFYTLKVVSSLKHKASGAVFDAIVTRDFDNEMINILSDTDAQQLLEVVTPMFAAIHNNDAECLRLSALRDAILPKLLSGELAFEAN